MKFITDKKFNDKDITNKSNEHILYVYVATKKMKAINADNSNYLKDLKMNKDTDNIKKIKSLFERAEKRINNTSLTSIKEINIYPGIFGQIKDACGANVGKSFSEELDKFKKNHGGGNGGRTARRNGGRNGGNGRNGNRSGRRNGNRSGRRNGNRTGNRSGRRNGGRTARRNSGRTNRGNGGRTARRTSRENKGNNMLNKIGKELRKRATSIKPKNNSSNTLNNNNNNSNSSNSNSNNNEEPVPKKRTKKKSNKKTSNNKPNKGLLKRMRDDIVPRTELLCGECKRNELLLDRELLEKDYGITKRYINRLKKAEKYCDKCLKLCKYMKKTTESKKLRKDQDIFRARYPKVCKRNTYGNIKALEIKKALRTRLIKQYEKLNK